MSVPTRYHYVVGNPARNDTRPMGRRWEVVMATTKRREQKRFTIDEWREFPLNLTSVHVGRAAGLCERTVRRHFSEFGGVRLGSRLVFSKAKVGEILGYPVD